MSQTLDLSKPHRPIQVGVILASGTTEILDVAPVDTLSALTKEFVNLFPEDVLPQELKAQALPFEFHWVSEVGSAGTARLTGGLTMVPTDSFESCPPLDITIMGANDVGYNPTAAELAYVRKAYDECSAFITICGGFQIPMMAGLFEGKKVTAPRMMIRHLEKEALGIKSEEERWVKDGKLSTSGIKWEEKRWVRDGKLWTSGALLNGMDLMHAFTHTYWGGENTLVDRLSKIGAWPNRDIDYKDVDWVY